MARVVVHPTERPTSTPTISSAHQLPQTAHPALTQVLKSARITAHRGRHSGGSVGTKTPELQLLLDNDLFCLHTDRRTKLNHIQQLSLLHLLAQFFLERAEDNNKYAYFEAIFLGREGEPIVHDHRISVLMQLASFSLQFPVLQVFNNISQWISKISVVKQSRYYSELLVDMLIDNFIKTCDRSRRMYEYLLPLEATCAEFTAIFTAFGPLVAPMSFPLAIVLQNYLSTNLSYIMRHYRDTPYLGDEFSTKTMPVLLKFVVEESANPARETIITSIAVSLAKVIEKWSGKFLTGRATCAKQPINFDVLFSKELKWNRNRCNLICAAANVDSNKKNISERLSDLDVPTDFAPSLAFVRKQFF